MSENPLVSTLTLSIQASGFSEAIKHLWTCHNIINNTPDAHLLIDFKVATLLNRLFNKYSSQIYLPLSRFYLAISKFTGKSASCVVLKICNDILMLCEALKSADISEELEVAVQDLLQILLTTELEEDQKSVVESLIVKKDYTNFDNKLNDIIQLVKENNLAAMNELFDLFSSFNSFSEQIHLFSTRLSPLISAMQEKDSIELAKKLLSFLENFVFKFNYNVQVGECTEIYSVCSINKLSTAILPTVISICNTLLAYDITITQPILPVLQRLWVLFPTEAERFYDITRIVLSAIAAQGNSDFKVKASGFLYEILNTPGFSEKLKDTLENSDDLSLLTNNDAFGPSSAVLESENLSKLEELQPYAGLPLNAYIEAGDEFYYCVEIVEANSILTWGFAMRYYDIDFELIRIDLPTPQIIIKQDHIECIQNAYANSKLINSPGLYKFVWSNKSSWFAAKHLRFRVLVLTPYHKVNITEKDLHKVIEVLCDDGIAYGSKDILEVGIHSKSKTVYLSALGIQEEIPDLDVNAILGFVKRVQGEKKYGSVKIGIVAKCPKKRNELKQLVSVAMCRDVDAVALLNESQMHCSTLICVMQDEGLRSCVVHRGHIMVDENGQPIADLARAGISDIYVGIATLLSLFGPGTVVLSGSEIPSVQEVLEKIESLVSESIMRQSLIRSTVYCPEATLTAASRLHFLNHKYRINS